MPEKSCVFVDGENLRHSIVDLFKGEFDKRDYLPKHAEWASFFDYLVERASPSSTRLRAYWYVVEYIDFFPYLSGLRKLNEGKLRRILSQNKKYKQELGELTGATVGERLQEMVKECESQALKMKKRFEWWRSVHDAIAKNHNAIEFRRAGAIKYDLFEGQLGTEKAVDVKLATDMIELREIYDTAVIVSGDQDYVPAVQVVKDSGKTVINVAFEARNGRLLPGGARRLNHLTDSAVIVKYADLKSFLLKGRQ